MILKSKQIEHAVLNSNLSENFRNDPFPHLEVLDFIDDSVMKELVKDFPSEHEFSSAKTLKSRATHNIYYTDSLFRDLINRSEAWRKLYEFINSKDFLAYFMSHFKGHLIDLGYQHNVEKIRFKEHLESREEISHSSHIRRLRGLFFDPFTKNNYSVFSRLDLSLGGMGYGKPPHADNENRLGGAVLYLNSADETETVGGDFQVWGVKDEYKTENLGRIPDREKLELQHSYPFRRNSALFFPCHDRSYHSVGEITSQKEKRKFLYLSLSFKSHNVW